MCWGHLENCKGQGRPLQLMATLCPLSIRLFGGFWQGDTGAAAIPLLLLGKLRHGVVPRAASGCAGRLQGKARPGVDALSPRAGGAGIAAVWGEKVGRKSSCGRDEGER